MGRALSVTFFYVFMYLFYVAMHLFLMVWYLILPSQLQWHRITCIFVQLLDNYIACFFCSTLFIGYTLNPPYILPCGYLLTLALIFVLFNHTLYIWVTGCAKLCIHTKQLLLCLGLSSFLNGFKLVCVSCKFLIILKDYIFCYCGCALFKCGIFFPCYFTVCLLET